MDNRDLVQQRIQLFRDATAFKKTDRIPHYANTVTWKVFDSGESLSRALTDNEIMEKCVRHFLDEYRVDGIIDLGIRNQFGVTDCFKGSSYYYYSDEVVGIKDHNFCTVDTLNDYLDNSEKYIWEKVLPEKFEDREISIEDFRKAFKQYLSYTFFIIKMGSVAKKEYGIPSMSPNNPATGTISFGIEECLANLLGIKQLSLALRRNPDELEAFIRKWDEKNIMPAIEKAKKGKYPNMKYAFDTSLTMLAHNFVNPKQFERFYWPYLEKYLDACAENSLTVKIFVEGSILRYADYFNKYPKGVIALQLEQDDLAEVREKIPNAALIGGIKTETLANGSAEDCINEVRSLIDRFGFDGGLILSENRMMSYRNDGKSENFRAVCDFINEYRG